MAELFGVAVSPFELAEWSAATSLTPDLCMVFENWNQQRSLRPMLTKVHQDLGHRQFMLTWEPWTPTPVGTPPEEQGALQPRWSNASIVRGEHNDYIDMIARDLRDCGIDTIYLRWGHEMNGTWYPWSHDGAAYVAAWKYLRNRIRTVRGAWNVKMVWAPNPDLWRATPADWLMRLLPYWPGRAAVDYVGFTMIERGPEGGHDYPVAEFAVRTTLSRIIFDRPIIAAEVNVVRELAVVWLNDMADYITNSHPYDVFILSQGPSRAQGAGNAGDLAWSAIDYVEGREAIRRVLDALHC